MSRLNGVEEIDDFSLKTGDCWDEYVPTGFPKLDAAMGGGLNIGLNILGALSALGKTTMMEQIATNISNMGREVLFVTLEMRKKQIAAKAISRQSYLQGGKDAAFTSAELTYNRGTGCNESSYPSGPHEVPWAIDMAVCEWN